MQDQLIEGELSHSIIGAFYEVYDNLGFGYIEKPYVEAMELELRERGHIVQREVPMPLFFKSIYLCSFRIDAIVDRKLILEIKAGESLPRGSLRQLNNYLKGTGLQVGLLLHFGLEPKFYRRVNTHTNTSSI
jgi:GxxExxY protein